MTDVVIRRATLDDVPAIIAMLADDPLGATRETPDDLTPYRRAFEAIDSDPNQLLVVADRNDEVIGTLQLTIIPGLSRQGATRALVEAVRVAASARGTGLGTTLMEWSIEEARARGCSMIQLTSDKTRTDAHRFYIDRLGFTNSHEGFKLAL
ncbi:L-amino acid N-acyltransferase YncA [Kribbella voronezhensis]|uniref:L-amino acid N-acyltransferase YncA n=1 Tax=Kribbella voronezhensis TaxID=2512212 RepID=A0A4R7TBS5_9ACTN|nr:GNAT family N-acetyltransferase [Kribbella voronezhensis]TDU88788.1 L-amino acid N-acyltransferase YncA [Kribbella voronezhensis]